MKFIHAADIHLDSPLVGLAAYEGAPVELLRTVTRNAFKNLVDLAIEEEIDFMIIAGDLYDGNWNDYNTGRFFCQEMGRLNKAGIRVYLLYGNHDAESKMTKSLLLPKNVSYFEYNHAHTFKIEEMKVALHGRSYKIANTSENLVYSYPAPEAGWLNIGVLHTALEGSSAHANYAPCTIAELSSKGYQYWALGHVHEYAVLKENPWIVFPGNLQGRHIKELGAKGAVLVTAEDSDIISVERLFVDVLRWHLVTIDVSPANSIQEVISQVVDDFQKLINITPEKIYVAVRVCIKGKTLVHGELFGLESQLREEILGQVAGNGMDRLWVEKVRIETTPLTAPAELSKRADAIADLQTILDGAHEDKQLLDWISNDLKPLLNTIPEELRNTLPELNSIRNGGDADIINLINSVMPSLLDYLSKTE